MKAFLLFALITLNSSLKNSQCLSARVLDYKLVRSDSMLFNLELAAATARRAANFIGNKN